MAQVYSGKKYSLFLGRQTDASTPVAMGTAQDTNSEFVELDVATITDVDFTGGLVADRTLRTGQQVKRLTDHYVSEKGATKTFSFEWVCSHKEGLIMLLEMISDGDTASPFAIAGNHEPATYSAAATTGALATVILKNLDSNKAAGQDRVMQDAALTSLSLRMEAGTSGGRLIASGTFMSGHTVSTASTSVVPSGTETAFVKTIYDCTTKTIDGVAVIVNSFSIDIANPCVRIGYDANGDAEAYSRAGEVTCAGTMNVLYDENSDAFLATVLQNPATTAGAVAPILFGDAAIGSGAIGFSVPQAVLTSHSVSIEGAEEGMMLEVGYEGTALAAQLLYNIDVSP
tara:strand:- start:3644 stop:4672 length:1029 start_codon:yes stop_codon:yes gene_type:complete